MAENMERDTVLTTGQEELNAVPEAIEAHARRYAAARKWRDEINRLCGAELIR